MRLCSNKAFQLGARKRATVVGLVGMFWESSERKFGFLGKGINKNYGFSRGKCIDGKFRVFGKTVDKKNEFSRKAINTKKFIFWGRYKEKILIFLGGRYT